MKSLLTVLFITQAMRLSHAMAADVGDGFGAFKDVDTQTKLVACEQAIYERNWYVYDLDLLVKGGLNTQQAEAAYETMHEAVSRQLFFSILAQSIDKDAYSGKLRQVDASMLEMYEQDDEAAVQEYKRLGEYCLTRIYPALIASKGDLAELEKLVRNIPISEELARAAKADFIMKATKGAVK